MPLRRLFGKPHMTRKMIQHLSIQRHEFCPQLRVVIFLKFAELWYFFFINLALNFWIGDPFKIVAGSSNSG